MLNFKWASPYRSAAPPSTTYLPEPVRSLSEDKQMSPNLALVLTALAATKALILRDFLEAVSFHKSPGYVSPLNACHMFCNVSTFTLVVLEMPRFSGKPWRCWAKCNWVMLTDTRPLSSTPGLLTKQSGISRWMIFREFYFERWN